MSTLYSLFNLMVSFPRLLILLYFFYINPFAVVSLCAMIHWRRDSSNVFFKISFSPGSLNKKNFALL